MDPKDYFKLMSRPNKMLIITKVSLILGIFLCFIGIFIHSIAGYILFGIGGVLILFYLLYTLIKYLDNKHPVKIINHKKKEKIYKVKKIKDDPTRVIFVCPTCQSKIRLPNKKGQHGVKCPHCYNEYKIKI